MLQTFYIVVDSKDADAILVFSRLLSACLRPPKKSEGAPVHFGVSPGPPHSYRRFEKTKLYSKQHLSVPVIETNDPIRFNSGDH